MSLMRILKKKHPEFASPKETSYCLFEKKTETYIKNGEEKSYERELHVLTRVTKLVTLFNS